MDIDSGSGFSILSYDDYRNFFSDFKLMESTKNLCVITGARVEVVGVLAMSVFYNNKKLLLKLIVVKVSFSFVCLMGRDWLDRIFPKWRDQLCQSVKFVNAIDDIKLIFMRQYSTIFDCDFTTPISGYSADIVMSPDAVS